MIIYSDGRSEQIGTPLVLAQFTFNLTAYQTMMKFQKLTDELSQQKGKQGEPKKNTAWCTGNQ